MEESTTKEKILKSVRNALINKTDNPFRNVDFTSEVFPPQMEEPEVEFALRLNESGGTFVYCENEKAFIENLNALISVNHWPELICSDPLLASFLNDFQINAVPPVKPLGFEVGITGCDFLISRFGSILISSAVTSRTLFAGADTHLVVAKASQVVGELKEALTALKTKYAHRLPSQITMITGPSRTADIEKTLVIGAHGSKNLIVFMIDDA